MENKNAQVEEEQEEEEGGESIERCRIGCVPTIFYISDFITHEEEQQLLNTIYKAPVAKWKVLKNRRLQSWGGVVHEKGLLAQDLPPWLTRISKRIFDKSGLFPSAINHVLINEYLPHQGIMPHQDGPAYYPVVAILSLGSPVIMDFTPHPSLQAQAGTIGNRETEDTGPEGPRQTSLDGSLNKNQPFSVLLMPRSLLIFKDEVYSDYLHGIEDNECQQYGQVVNFRQTTQSRGQIQSAPDSVREAGDKLIRRTATRVSLTCRTVMKVHKNWLKV